MAKKVKHMGMMLTEAEHDRWHKRRRALTPAEHRALMKKMGISREQDEAWHKEHGPPPAPKKSRRKPVNPFAIGGGFLAYCVRQGWLTQEGAGRGARYYATREGKKELKKFGIQV
jgi:hypothetical protein